MVATQAWQSGETVGHCNLRLARGSAYGVMPDFSIILRIKVQIRFNQ